MVLVEGLPLVVGCVAEHSQGVDVTLLIAGLGEDVLRSKVVQGRVGVQGATTVPLTKCEGCLEGGDYGAACKYFDTITFTDGLLTGSERSNGLDYLTWASDWQWEV